MRQMRESKRIFFLLRLGLFSLFSSTAHAGIPWQAFYGVSPYFKEPSFSPTFGEVALKSGLIYNLRFYGNLIPQFKSTGKRLYVKDTGKDGMTKLVRALFPSPAGALAVETQAKDNLGRFMSPQTVALFLNLVHSLRTSSSNTSNPKEKMTPKEIKKWTDPLFESLDHEKKEAVWKHKTEAQKKKLKTNLITEINRVITSITEGILEETEETRALYPKHMIEQVLLAFFCEKFNSQKDIWELARALSDDLVTREAKKALPHTEQLLQEQDLEALQAKSVYNLDEAYALLMAPAFKTPTPYAGTQSLMGNGNAYGYDRKAQKTTQDVQFADCAENALRQLLNCVLFDPKTRTFNLEPLTQKAQGHPTFPLVEEFYQAQPPFAVSRGDSEIRSKFAHIFSDLNTEHDPRQVAYLRPDGRNELKPGYVNFLRAFEKVFGMDFGDVPQKEDAQKAWIDQSYQTIFESANPAYRYEIKVSSLKPAQDEWGEEMEVTFYPKPKEGETIGILNRESLVTLKLKVDVGSHAEMTELNYGTPNPYGEFPQKVVQNKNPLSVLNTPQYRGTALETAWFLLPKQETRNHTPAPGFGEMMSEEKIEFTSPLWMLLSTPLVDNAGKGAFIQTLASQYTRWKDTLFKTMEAKALLHRMVESVLRDISWEDGATLMTISPAILQLAQEVEFHPILEKTVQGLSLQTTGTISSFQDLFKESSLQGSPLKLPHLKTLGLENGENLNLDLRFLGNLKSLFIQGATGNLKFTHAPKSLESVGLASVSLASLTGLEKLESLKDLDLRNIEGLQKLNFKERLPDLETLYIANALDLQEIEGLENLCALKTFNLMTLNKLKSLDFKRPLQIKNMEIDGVPCLKKIRGLENLKALRELRMKGLSNFKKLIFTKDMPNLEEIDINGIRASFQYRDLIRSTCSTLETAESILEDIEGLEHLTGLKKVSLTNFMYLRSLLFKKEMKKLESIELSGALEILELEYLKNLKRLDVIGVDPFKLKLKLSEGNNAIGIKRYKDFEKVSLEDKSITWTPVSDADEINSDSLSLSSAALNISSDLSLQAQRALQEGGLLEERLEDSKKLAEGALQEQPTAEDLSQHLIRQNLTPQIEAEKKSQTRKMDLKQLAEHFFQAYFKVSAFSVNLSEEDDPHKSEKKALDCALEESALRLRKNQEEHRVTVTLEDVEKALLFQDKALRFWKWRGGVHKREVQPSEEH